jgi:predicted XRE-type DNA-binding protein
MEEGAIDMARKDIKTQTFDDVFDALSDTPAEAANMRARSDLLAVIVKRVETWNVSQEAAAARLKITRPRLNDLMRGKLGKFSLDALVNLATASGLVLKIQVKTKIEKAA